MLLNQVADYQMSKGTPQNLQIAQSSTKYWTKHTHLKLKLNLELH